uniref:Uncharacterized protein n=1 Tax=Manihot esculenta TaxID=3983 RepID=A0A2C9U4N7_MANES
MDGKSVESMRYTCFSPAIIFLVDEGSLVVIFQCVFLQNCNIGSVFLCFLFFLELRIKLFITSHPCLGRTKLIYHKVYLSQLPREAIPQVSMFVRLVAYELDFVPFFSYSIMFLYIYRQHME